MKRFLNRLSSGKHLPIVCALLVQYVQIHQLVWRTQQYKALLNTSKTTYLDLLPARKVTCVLFSISG